VTTSRPSLIITAMYSDVKLTYLNLNLSPWSRGYGEAP